LEQNLPTPLNSKFVKLFTEFEEQKTLESRFAKAIDALDAEIHEIDYKQDWEGWTKEFLVANKLNLFEEFPEMQKVLFEILHYLKANYYFNQNRP
jgi:5'-deoxynucleotidase YfbR-like HD superfamily hydrolase